MANRNVSSLFIVLLLTSALFVSIFSVVTPPKMAHAATLTFAASSGRYGDVITFKTTSLGTAANGTSCSFTGAPTNVVTNFHGQEYKHNATGWFVVGTGPSGVGGLAYTLTITCGGDTGTLAFTVIPSFIVSPPISEAGNTVTVAAYGLPSDTSGPCWFTGNRTATAEVVASPAPCAIVAGSGSATGTFTVASAAINANYTMIVHYSGTTFSSAEAAFRKVAANTPTAPGFPLLMSPHSAPPGWGTVSISGGGFTKTTLVRSCAITFAATLVVGDVVSPSCTIDTNGILTAGFVVGPSAVPTHAGLIQIVDATTSGGPFSAGTFTVDATASPVTRIQHLGASTQGSGPAGTFVNLGPLGTTKLSPLDAGACTISSNPTALISSYFCVIDTAGRILNATFVVPANAPGQAYTLTITGNHGDTAAVTPTFLVTPAVTVNPTSGSPPVAALSGTPVVITGTGFKPDTDGCKLNSTSPPPHRPDIIGSSYSCTVTGSTGALSATFVVQAGALNYTTAYQLQVNGTKSGAMNEANVNLYASFYVVPRIVLNPTSGVSGQTIAVLGSGFQAEGTPKNCRAIEAWQAGFLTPSPFSASSCTVSTTGVVTASFTVAATLAYGVYTIRVAGADTATPFTDNATATFTKGVPMTLTISPSSGFTGTGPVSVTGTFAIADAGACTIDEPAGSHLFSGVPSPTCTISSSGALTASFTVSTTAQGGTWSVQVHGAGGGFGSGNFAVTPKMTLTPSSGESFTSVSITGSGFSAADAGAGCAGTLYSTPIGLLGPGVSCSISATTFQMSGSFAVAGAAAPGTYTVIFPSSLGSVSATPSFTKSPSAFTLTPNYGPLGTLVSVSGTGFTPTDTGCAITSAPNIIASSTCSITGGVVTGSFTVVGTGVVPQTSTVTVTGTPSGILKSAPFQLTPTIMLSPSSGRANTPVSVSGSNFVVGDIGCVISSSPSGLISSPSCVVIAGTMSGSFTVASGSSGNYTVLVTGTSGDVGHATFRVPPPPTLTLGPLPLGPSGTSVTASGSNFAGTTCQLTANPGGLFTSSSCSLAAGSLTAGSGFIVASGATVGTAYTVTVTTNLGAADSATATFTVTAGPVGTLTLNPTSGQVGTVVSGSATGFTTDSSCLLSAAPSAVLSSASCSITGGGNANAGFTVASNAPAGRYAILLIGNTGKSAAGNFTVLAGPQSTFTLTPTLGPVGTAVTISGSSYAGVTCTLSSSPVGLFTSSSCSITAGTLSGGFSVASGASLGYVVTVTTNLNEMKTAPFTVSSMPGPTLSPTSGSPGTSISVSGSGYRGTTCTLSSVPSGLFSSSSCSISSGTLTASFTIASGASGGSYTVKVTTDAGETATSQFTVKFALTFALDPTSGGAGAGVTASGSNYAGTTCSISATPSALFSSSSCSIAGGTLTGGFTVASSASGGSYTVKVTTDSGELMTATFAVTTAPTFILSPSSGGVTTGVTIAGSNYHGATCSLSASPSGLFTSSSCSISSGALSGGFTVDLLARGSYTVTVATDAGETKSTQFTVVSKACIIATATFGSEASPAVQFLRGFRDHLVLGTRAGSAFMEVFNTWYYSFSPSVAKIIADNDPLRAPARVILYPLLGVLSASAFTYSLFSASPEFAVVMAGLVASSLIGLVYLTIPALVAFRSLKRRIRVASIARASLSVLAVALALLVAGELAGSFLLLAVASSAIVLTCIIAAPTIIAVLVLRPKSQ